MYCFYMSTQVADDMRKKHELEHGRKLMVNPAHIWGHASLAGQRRVNRRIVRMTELLRPTTNTRIVELGCGTGIFSRELAKTGAQILSIDLSPELLSMARSSVQASNVQFLEGDCMELEKIPQVSNVDAVAANSVLHHLNVPKALHSMFQVLRPGGMIVFSEPNMVNPQIFLQKNIPWIKRLAGDSPDEIAFVRWSLKKLLEQTGFVDVSVEPFDFLHPATPDFAVDVMEKIGIVLETVPVIKEITGSLFISARKPS